MTILELADAAGIDGHHIRLFIKQQISDVRKDKLAATARVKRLYETSNGVVARNYGSLRKPCPDCLTEPPDINEDCIRCVRRSQERARYKTSARKIKHNQLPTCEGNKLNPKFKDNCGFKAKFLINDIPVCGFHKAIYIRQMDVTVKCRADDITDRFKPCVFKASSEWNGLPICGRHRAALSGSRGEQKKNEVWRNIKKEQRQQINTIDNAVTL